jgi:hypothetical protein
MEQQHQSQPERGWDAVPRDGPAVLVVDAHELDEGRGLVGGWIELSQSISEVAQQIEVLLGREAGRRTPVVIDQIGMGSVMCDEDEIAELLRLATRRPGLPDREPRAS